jgi:hypothetical protein
LMLNSSTIPFAPVCTYRNRPQDRCIHGASLPESIARYGPCSSRRRHLAAGSLRLTLPRRSPARRRSRPAPLC